MPVKLRRAFINGFHHDSRASYLSRLRQGAM